jgi:hypothetical protein
MADNTPDAGSELNPKDAAYELPALPSIRVPTSIDGESHEVAAAALEEYERVLIALTGYAQSAEAMVRTAMLDEALSLPGSMLPLGDAAAYPDATYELQAIVRANRALAIAINLLGRARAELEKPVAESRRLVS